MCEPVILSYLKNLYKEYPIGHNISTKLINAKADAAANNEPCIWDHVIVRQNGPFVILHYDTKFMYEGCWDDFNGALRECRGIVIDTMHWEVAAWPYNKFFNYGEKSETQPKVIAKRIKEAEVVQVADKLDGSLLNIRWYNNKFIVATSTFMTYGKLDDDCCSLYLNVPEEASVLRKAIKYMMDYNLSYLNTIKRYFDYTFMFEFLSDEVVHVVDYIKKGMSGFYLHGLRNMITAKCLSYKEVVELASELNIPHTSYYADMTLADVLLEKPKYDFKDKEGYVLYIDGYFLKVKCDQYINKAAQEQRLLNPNGIMKLYTLGTLDEATDDLNIEQKAFVNKIKDEIENYISFVTNAVDAFYKQIEAKSTDKRSFFEELNKYKRRSMLVKLLSMKYLNGKDFDLLVTPQGRVLCYTHMLENIEKIQKEMKEFGVEGA